MKSNKELDFRKTNNQVYYCHWRKRDRTMVFNGRCRACGKRTYVFTDGENDPRGPLGDFAGSNLRASDCDMTGPDVVACFNCTNDERRYQRLMDISNKIWKKKGA